MLAGTHQGPAGGQHTKSLLIAEEAEISVPELCLTCEQLQGTIAMAAACKARLVTTGPLTVKWHAPTASSSTSAGVMPALMHWMCLSGMQSISLAATTAFALMKALSLRSWST
jgi:hypothetical protein